MAPLTEGWAAAYFGALVVVLVFAVGLQGFIYQIMVPDDLRIVAHRRRHAQLSTPIALIVLTSAVGFVWLHPDGVARDGSPGQAQVAGAVMTLVLVITVGYCWALSRQSSRSSVVKRAVQEALEPGIRQLHEPAISDLAYLGEHGSGGAEKALVLSALSEIVSTVQGDASYQGSELEDVITAVAESVLGHGEAGTDNNFSDAARIFGDILSRCAARQLESCPDGAMAWRAATRLATHAVRHKAEAVVFSFVNIGVSHRSMLHAIGIEAIATQRYVFVLAALNKLEADVDLTLLDRSADYIGLVARLWSCGISGRDQAGRSFGRVRLLYPLAQLDFDAMATIYQSQGDFETADAIKEFAAASRDVPQPA